MPESSALRLGKDDLILDIPKASHGSEVVLSYLGRRFPAEFHLLIHFGIPPFAQFFWVGFSRYVSCDFFASPPVPPVPPSSQALWAQLLSSSLHLAKIFEMHVRFVRDVRLEPELIKFRGSAERKIPGRSAFFGALKV